MQCNVHSGLLGFILRFKLSSECSQCMLWLLILSKSSACEALRLQQHFLPISKLYAVSSPFLIEEQHNALLSVQLWPADEPADTDMNTSRYVHTASLLLL